MPETAAVDRPEPPPAVMRSTPKKPLGDRLIEAGLLSRSQLDLAVREQKRKGGLIDQILSDLGFVSQEVICRYVAEEAEARVVNVKRAVIERAVLQLIPFEVAKRFRALPLSQDDHTLTVALANPSNVVATDTLQQLTGLNIDVVTAPERDILNTLELHYQTAGSIEESIDKALDWEPDEPRTAVEVPTEEGEMGYEDAPIIRLTDQIIARAVQNRASDIHFEPEEKIMRIRSRIDGVLFQDVLIPKSMQSAVIARLKIMAELDVAEQRLPQDGRATISVDRRELNLRVSSLPSAWGENVVLRILDSAAQNLTLPGLGFSTEDYELFLSAVKRPYGVVLVTGPTGSGKTTTLYAALKEISTMDVSVFTLEDPIEYRMPLIRQTQIKEEIGLTFGTGLRALLRQDPDIILVGETRDTETAQLMVRAALTGHLVLSTLHTNDAAGAIPRLIDMGVEPYLLPASLIAVMAQRLVRTICTECKHPIKDPARVFKELKLEAPTDEPLRLWKGSGCPACNASGYKGRQAIFEMMPVDDRFHEPIIRRAGAPEYVRLGRERGMRTMFEDGLRKVLQGVTTIEELLETTRLADG